MHPGTCAPVQLETAERLANTDREMPARTDPLASYHRKRDFHKTREPAGRTAAAGGWSYCVQRHAASRLHYDFRLELDGVLKSWAVPRGPSLDPADKRLAVMTEDHPVDYGSFEGVITEGEYGGGTVLLWDRGTWEPIGDPRRGLARGKLEFTLHGEKLQGRFVLVKLRDGDDEWLLMKGRDEHVRSGNGAIVDVEPTSVASGRDITTIAAEEGGTEAQIERAAGKPGRRKTTRTRPRRATAVVELPAFVPSQLATLVAEPPEGPQWLHEIKFDGYRLQLRKDGDDVRITSRNEKDWTSRLPHLVDAVRRLPTPRAIVDGELVHVDAAGRTSFQRAAKALGNRTRDELLFQAFDLLFVDEASLLELSLAARKQRLQALCADAGPTILYTDDVRGHGRDMLREACALGLEGIVCKRVDAPHRGGRSGDWLEAKCLQRQEFVIVGWTPPTHARDRLGSLVLAVGDGGRLVYAGRVGTGFAHDDRVALRRKLDTLARATPALASRPRASGLTHVHWVTPRLVCEVAFSEWTDDGRLRHPSFQGLREDKAASEVVRERPRASTPGPAVAAAGGDVAITNADKLLYPDAGITKLALVRYYQAAAARMLPHLRDRPLMLRRCPDGSGGPCFFQKHVGNAVPAAIHRIEIVEDDGKRATYLAVDDVDGIVAAVQLGALELHVWGSRRDRLERPDRLVFDLDPDPSVSFATVRESAVELRDQLAAVDLRAFAMVTGGKGVHVVVPLRRVHDFDTVKAFAHGFARALVAAAPKRYVAEASKHKRKGRIFVDYLRNGRGATAICPYSTRATPQASVAVPVGWDELEDIDRADGFRLPDVTARLDAADPWHDYAAVDQRIAAAVLRASGVQPATRR